MAFPTPKGRLQIGLPLRHPTVNLGRTLALATWNFFTTGTSTPANVYQDGALNTVFSPTGVVTADANGKFPPIYLDTSVVYKAQLKTAGGVVVRTYDPYQGSLAAFGTSIKQAFGLAINAQNEVTITETTGGTGVAVTIGAVPVGGACIQVASNSPGAVPIAINSSATTGSTNAFMSSLIKPGNVQAQVALTAAPTGATYTGGTLTAPWPYATSVAYQVTLSTGQVIQSCTFTNGSTTFVCPSTNITGTPTVNLSVNAGTGPVVWVPITLDGQTYYLPMWRGDLFVPIKPPPTVVGETIIGGNTATFNPDGTTSVQSPGTATPSSWYLPTTANIGSSYYVKVTKTGGTLTFNAAGSFTNISNSGLTIGTSHGLNTTQVTGTYQISSSPTGAIIAATGSITLQGDIVPTNTQTITGGNTVTFNGDGTTTVPGGSASPTNWYSPTTASIGSQYWVQVTKTGGVLNFNAATGAMTNITAGGLTIGTTNGLTTEQVIGTYAMSWNNGAVATGSGTITLQGNGVGPNYTGTERWQLNTDGTASLNGSASTNWFLPTTTSIGNGYWVSLTRTGGTTGVNFDASTSFFNINVNQSYGIATNHITNVSVIGTYTLSTSSSGTPVVGTGTVTLSGNGVLTNFSGAENWVLNSDGSAAFNGSATSNWFAPTTTSIGNGYWVSLTRTGGTTGVNFNQGTGFNALSGAVTYNITNYLTNVSVTGTYTLSSSSGGTPVVGTGSVTITGNGAGPSFSGTESWTLNNDGTTTFNGSGSTNWYTPTTASVGANYWVSLSRTGGTTGVNFVQGTGFNQISGAPAYTITNFLTNVSVTGTYSISSSSSGTPVVGSGTVTISGNGSGPAFSGAQAWVMGGDGTVTMNGVSQTNWYTPTTANTGSSYWINITRTGGTTSCNFGTAQGSWVNIGNSGLSISQSGLTVGSFSITGTYALSTSSSGTPQVGSGNVTLTGNLGSSTTTIGTASSGSVTIPNGCTSITIEVGGGGASGGGGNGSLCVSNGGGGGGSGAYVKHVISVTSANWGQTINYTVGGGGASVSGNGVNGNNGTASTVSSGTFTITTLTAGGGTHGNAFSNGAAGGAGGTASGGNTLDTNGNSGGNGAAGNAGAGGTAISGTNIVSGRGGNGAAFGAGSSQAGSVGGVSFTFS